MSWQLVSFLILGGVLLAGFAWYERSRPPSQVVALVAALAALAIAGRVAFAALPNVKPLTTDVVVFAGYALGGAPGFAVGALAALVSNFWFGQGPWTPWQMAAWGLCGILGAVLALGTRNAGRLSLAATCGLAAVLYGALLNFSLMATYGGELSLRYFGVLEARAIPFEIAHAGGNVAFALLAGPAMVRMLTRFRERFQWRRGELKAPPPRPSGADGSSPAPEDPGGEREGRPSEPAHGAALRAGGVALLLLAALALGAATAPRADAAGVASAAAWLRSAQNEDGGFPASPGGESSAEVTCWAALALAAAKANPLDVASHGHTPIDFIRSHLGQVRSPGDYARTILAVESAGANPRNFGGRNLVAALLNRRRSDGSYEDWPGTTAFAVIALKAAGATGGLEKTRDWLRSVQNADGGWGDVPGSPSTPDGTGAAMQALGSGSKAVERGVGYLRSHQRRGGGFALGGNGLVNTPSTAWAVQGLIAAGRNPAGFRKGGASALDYLAASQGTDGSYSYAQAGAQTSAQVAHQTPVWVTTEVIPAAAGVTFPVPAPPRAPRPKPTTPSQPTPSTGTAPSTISPLPSTGSSGSTGSPAYESVPPTGTGSTPASPSGTSGGGGGSPAGHSAPSGGSSTGAQPNPGSTGGRVPQGTTATAPDEASASRQEESTPTESGTDSSSVAGSIITGLLAGCLLFGFAWAARRGWMRWRYGL